MKNKLLEALTLDKVGKWEEAHAIIQDISGKEAANIHAYLHRKEGDLANARYWYFRSGTPFFKGTLAEEWDSLWDQFSG